MTDYENELLADFGSDGESDVDVEGIEDKNLEVEDENGYVPGGPREKSSESSETGGGASLDPGAYLRHLISNSSITSLQKSLETFDISKIYDITKDSKVLPIIGYLRDKISSYQDDMRTDYEELMSTLTFGTSSNSEVSEHSSSEISQYQFILMVNEISSIINNEVSFIHAFNTLHYKVVFRELETIVSNPVDYARIMLLIEQDLSSINKYQEDLKSIVSNEKVLVITMSAIQQVQNSSDFKLSEPDFNTLRKSSSLVLELNELLQDLSVFISNKLFRFAPNINAIVGPITTSQLLTASGSLKQLSITPSCNLPSLGVKDLSSQTSGSTSRRIRQTGYLYHNELVNQLPEEIQKPVLRILSGKITLAARVDLSKNATDGSLGSKYRLDIENKIEKLLAPPENRGDKALPIPMDPKSKKRGGRRFRKARERLQMSDLRKAQNKMAFGQQEDSIMDSFGEEIGLGMSRGVSTAGGSSSLNIKVNNRVGGKVSKAMEARLKNEEANVNLDNFLQNTNKEERTERNATNDATRRINDERSESKWFSGMKRKRDTND
ncbi:pre-mRNA-processing factor 31 [[Candida] railenensis]|uniref:Pre-mRNA-processing factor 31 n=1 Tax=[Candida] railenensis TaxID=45579 RepID=A0A9P0VYE6_9ASCO|nr:pre-mRNA-processing factor 31 [[Candida] railenensis]